MSARVVLRQTHTIRPCCVELSKRHPPQSEVAPPAESSSVQSWHRSPNRIAGRKRPLARRGRARPPSSRCRTGAAKRSPRMWLRVARPYAISRFSRGEAQPKHGSHPDCAPKRCLHLSCMHVSVRAKAQHSEAERREDRRTSDSGSLTGFGQLPSATVRAHVCMCVREKSKPLPRFSRQRRASK